MKDVTEAKVQRGKVSNFRTGDVHSCYFEIDISARCFLVSKYSCSISLIVGLTSDDAAFVPNNKHMLERCYVAENFYFC